MFVSFVYIVTNRPYGVLYTGVTSNIVQRISEHKYARISGFTNTYRCKMLVYYRVFENIIDAFGFEKQLKRWKRCWKIQMIEEQNPYWKDLYEDVYQVWH